VDLPLCHAGASDRTDFGARITTVRVVKLPVIYVGGKLPVTYRPLPARMGRRALVLKGVVQSLGLMTVIYTVNIS